MGITIIILLLSLAGAIGFGIWAGKVDYQELGIVSLISGVLFLCTLTIGVSVFVSSFKEDLTMANYFAELDSLQKNIILTEFSYEKEKSSKINAIYINLDKARALSELRNKYFSKRTEVAEYINIQLYNSSHKFWYIEKNSPEDMLVYFNKIKEY